MSALPPLGPEDFAPAFAAVHGHPPFPWQERLVAHLASGEVWSKRLDLWPKRLDLPTASGKTAALDAALFHLALEAGRGELRRAPMRIAFVVDRRIIVDAAASRARELAEKLSGATGDGPLARMATRLRHLAGEGEPLQVSVLRGGLPREEDWARSPGQPAILCSTIDQVGSRLLFRGYGVSDRMRPVHAGLLGSDCLILLDEAHLGAPFLETLDRIAAYRRPDWCERKPGPWGVVAMSATPRGAEDSFSLDASDRAHPVLARRLGAAKPATLRLSPQTLSDGRRRDPFAGHASVFASATKDLLAASPVRRLAVVVNRVALARSVFAELKSEGCLGAGADIVLLTGRIRGYDRDALTERLEPLLRSGAADPADGRPIVVVATQTIEAGADFDFDALVTQLAPLDALRQRFGRLNRMGRDIPARAVIIATREEVKAKAEDPLYGDRAAATWERLNAIASHPARRGAEPVVDFGIDALAAALAGVDPADLNTKSGRAPILRPADVQLLSMTSPVPAVDPDVAPFLHGPEAGPADVQLVWRADLAAKDLEGGGAPHLPGLIALAPPRVWETLAVPPWAARAWLEGRWEKADTADLEGAPVPRAGKKDSPPHGQGSAARLAFRWAGSDHPATGAVRPDGVRPGDVLVVPSTYGGCDTHGWLPSGSDPVKDIGQVSGRDPASLRLHVQFPPCGDAAANELAQNIVKGALAMDGDGDEAENHLRSLHPALMGGREEWVLHRLEGYAGFVLVEPRRRGDPQDTGAGAEDASTSPIPVDLARHAADVEERARSFAASAGLPPAMTEVLTLAALLHDDGKADPRFQLLLHGGDRLAALAALAAGKLLAKSAAGTREGREAGRAVGLPPRWRHEARSAALAARDPRLARLHDPALALWLIGTHHGYGRPLFPHDDPREPGDLPGPQRLDFLFDGDDWPQLRERLTERYGPWELARFEAVLRLADHSASARERP